MPLSGLSLVLVVVAVIFAVAFLGIKMLIEKKRDYKNYERALKMVPMLIHLPPSTSDIEGGGRDERDVLNEQISQAQVMYSVISSTLKKGFASKLYGQKHLSFEIVAHGGLIKYYALVPAVLTETIKQAVAAAYPTARLEEVEDANFFSPEGGLDAVAGGEFELKKGTELPIATYESSKRDAVLALINAMSAAKKDEGIGLQIIFRPSDHAWIKKAEDVVKNIKSGKRMSTLSTGSGILSKIFIGLGQFAVDFIEAFWKPPAERAAEQQQNVVEELSALKQEQIAKIEDKIKYPGFETLIRVVASAKNSVKSEALLAGVVAIFSQFDDVQANGFSYNFKKDRESLIKDYVLRSFPQESKGMILNSVEMATIFHLPSRQSIPTSQVERQSIKQVDGPAKLVEQGLLLGVNEFRGEVKEIRLSTEDRRRHTYMIGATGSGKSVFLTNLAYQDMCAGRGFCFIDPHGDAVETILSKVPKERMDDVILFEPGNIENPVGMNMLEYSNEDQKDFVVQESLNILQSLYDPDNQGIFGPRAHHMFRNAALLLMSDPHGGTFIDVPRCFIDAEFVKEKLKYVTDKNVWNYWVKEFPDSRKSSDAGEVITWFVSKWGPFLSNQMMRNILGQEKSGFNIREIMDNKKILLVNLSKGLVGEMNAKLLGMIFVMKFQAAAMSRADIPEEQRKDFCLFVDEFQNFSTESFESILSEARKYRLNLVLANQFMTQLTDKIREGILGNVGTIISGRLGVTDAEMMEKAFAPVFNAEDLHKLPNYNNITTVMMYGVPSSPFTMRFLPSMGDANPELMRQMRLYASTRYGRPRAEVNREIEERLMTSAERRAERAKKIEVADKAEAAADLERSDPETTATIRPQAKANFADDWLNQQRSRRADARSKVNLDQLIGGALKKEEASQEEKKRVQIGVAHRDDDGSVVMKLR